MYTDDDLFMASEKGRKVGELLSRQDCEKEIATLKAGIRAALAVIDSKSEMSEEMRRTLDELAA